MARILPLFLLLLLLTPILEAAETLPEPDRQVSIEDETPAEPEPVEAELLPPDPVELGGICGIDRNCALGCDDDIGAPCSEACDVAYTPYTPAWYACENACAALAQQCLFDRGCFIPC